MSHWSFLTVLASAQAATATGALSLDQLLEQIGGATSAFKLGSYLVGLSLLVNLVVNLTKVGFIGTFIEKKNIKWIRPLLAILGGVVGGLATAVAEGKPAGVAAMYAVAGIFTGGGAVAFHELYTAIKGAVS